MGVAARIDRVTFAAGELGENLIARSDMAVYQIAVEQMENFVPMKEGGAMRAPGTRMVLELKNEAQLGRLLPFRYSPTDYYMLVINGGVSRLVREGGFVQNEDTTPFEFAVPWAEADLASLRAARSGNTLYVVSAGKKPQELTRSGVLTWACADYMPNNGPVDTQNVDAGKTVKASAATGTGITLTGTGGIFDASQIGGVFRIDDRDLSATPEWSAIETAIPQNAQRRWNGNVYRATLTTADAGPNAPVHTEGSVSAGQKDNTTPYQTWEFLHPGYGFTRITAVANANSATADVLSRLPDTVVSAATLRWYPPAWTDVKGWPNVIAFRTPRLMFARGPQLWASANDDPHNHDLGRVLDTDAIADLIRAPDDSLVDIQWMLPAGVMILGTSDLEWMFRMPDFYASLTPKAGAFDCGSDGSASAEAVKVDGGVMWVGKTSKRIHYAAAIDAQAQNFEGDEISVRAAHIFAPGIAKMAWQKDPNRVMWIALKDGTLASLTFMPKQQVCAFARHPRTNFFVEDIAVIPGVGSGVDEVYLIVRRTINGQTRRFVEQLANFFTPIDPANPTADGAWFLDCALNLVSDTPVSQVTQLAHLEGQTVGVFADGAMQKRKVVTGGTIDLDRDSKNVLVGLPIRGYVRDLPRNFNLQGGATTGAEKTVHDAIVRLKHAGGGMLRVFNPEEDNPDLWEALIVTGADDYDSAPPLVTDQIRAQVEGDLSMEAQLEFVCDDAMPCTLLAMSPKIDVWEDG
ncbi:hypothetical protein [Afipia felis]|uniref:Uncharacterized protein n=2 Tax=Afipia felis TaxID=1035 RepID=A0A380W5T4_AFIFE|nr:hypothetical protein [Afipia felis]EKS26520.1 hypothetical protein HMPREF9697_04027 [Afipia felis ATCC 53690]SUU76169.1 Uncharacterised protein [Afipia felis]SUU84236.1 Uncharacterised protein [Afipia felis]